MSAKPFIADEMVAAYARDGVVFIPGLLSDRLEALAADVEANIAAPSPLNRSYKPADGSAPFFQDYCNWQRYPAYRRAILESAMAECAARLMQSRTARIFHEHVLVKEPGNSMKTPWHQDQPYYLVEGRQSVSFWVPLDPVPRAISVEYVAGSHRWGKDFRPQRFDGTALYQGDASEAVPDVEAKREDWPVLGFDMQPGDAVAFDFRTLHGAPANTTARRRRAISFRWVGDDARFAKRKGRTSPPFPDLAFEDGQPFGGPEFPIVWPASASPAG
ncbi:MAG: phytanoyl-CoA dioxygenase family protein [Hyphomicrobiaceae bacterium]|nr:phytanoyl-CoA dioxygenase family protein [Hyphomicrobiaceae bacterium]